MKERLKKTMKKRNCVFEFFFCLSRLMHIDGVLYYLWEYVLKRFFHDEEMKKSRAYFENNRDKIEYIINHLSDDKSCHVYESCIAYRVARRPMGKMVDEDIEQYFAKDIVKLKNESFVDCGAFTGDTLKQFLNYTGGVFEEYYAFEPDEVNSEEFKKYMESLACIDRIHLFDLAVSEKKETLHFSRGGDGEGVHGTSAIDESGNVTINANSLDNVLQDKKVTFIKMDIEGAETSALKGAWNVIYNNRPLLAICIYHSMQDMVEIPYEIISKLQNYDFHIRHYTRVMAETVFYAIPKEREDENVSL